MKKQASRQTTIIERETEEEGGEEGGREGGELELAHLFLPPFPSLRISG